MRQFFVCFSLVCFFILLCFRIVFLFSFVFVFFLTKNNEHPITIFLSDFTAYIYINSTMHTGVMTEKLLSHFRSTNHVSGIT